MPMKSILHVVENLFATISIVMVEFRSPTLQNLDLAERVMIMRFALLGILLYLGKSDTYFRIPTVKLKIPGKSIFEIRIPNFCYIQVIVFDLSYLPVAAVGTYQVRCHL